MMIFFLKKQNSKEKKPTINDYFTIHLDKYIVLCFLNKYDFCKIKYEK